MTLHVPETPRTYHLIGEAQLARMRPGAKLINASRGTVVDIDALARALDSGHLAGAAIDVFPVEPGSNDQEFASPLRRFDSVILTPHIGGSTLEAQENIGIELAAKLIKYSDNGSTVTAVNFPEVALTEHAGKHRILHIHRNQPGVLAELNRELTAAGLNILGQHLKTDERTGYVITDVDRDYDPEALLALKTVAGTLRFRMLH